METITKEKVISRRTFFKRSAGVVAGVIATSTLVHGSKATGQPIAAGLKVPLTSDTLTMLNDLQKALDKPMEERKWAMVIDIRKCIGCSACTAACIAENNSPRGVTYRTVPEVEDGKYPKLRRFFMPTNCMQCEKAPCIDAANGVIPGSMSRRPDGIVTIDYEKMKGEQVFKAASKACPYPHSLWYDEGKNYTDGTPAIQLYEQRKVNEYGQMWDRKETAGATRKCHFCTQRIDAGMLPACVATCTGQAMHFGDLNDPESLASGLLKKYKSFRMDLGSGAEPKIHYLTDDPETSCMECHS